jgi:hypothetical protein
MSVGTERKTDFSQKWKYADITFVVEGKKVFANKMILSLWSPVFEAMFTHDFKEKGAEEIPLPEKKFEEIIQLMKVLHPPNEEINSQYSILFLFYSIPDDNVSVLLPLLQEYQIDAILQRAEEFLCSQCSSIKNFLLAQRFNLKELYESNLSYLRQWLA